MQTQNRLFDDIAKVAGGALSALGSLKQEIEALVRERIERTMTEANVVPRAEFDAVKEVAATARLEQEKLSQRVDALEKELARLQKSGS